MTFLQRDCLVKNLFPQVLGWSVQPQLIQNFYINLINALSPYNQLQTGSFFYDIINNRSFNDRRSVIK